MDLNFNNYICSVIALSLINLSNFWGAVHMRVGRRPRSVLTPDILSGDSK